MFDFASPALWKFFTKVITDLTAKGRLVERAVLLNSLEVGSPI